MFVDDQWESCQVLKHYWNQEIDAIWCITGKCNLGLIFTVYLQTEVLRHQPDPNSEVRNV